jgi:ribonuclease HI
MPHNNIVVYTDGACSGNPGPGGWGALLKWNGSEKELCGGESHTTNNRMELRAAIEALKAIKNPKKITLYTDSVYLQKGMTEWLEGWKKNQWEKAKKKKIKNLDLWQELDDLMHTYTVEWRWVKGHSGNEGNERADELARRGIEKLTCL